VRLHVLAQQRTRLSDVDRGVLFIAGQNPNRDSRAHELLDAPRNAVLQFVLDGGGAEQLQLFLDGLGARRDFLVPLLQALRRIRVRRVPRRVLRFRERALGETQRAQTARRVVVHVRLRRRGVRLPARDVPQPLVHDAVCALAVQNNLALWDARDDAHALAR